MKDLFESILDDADTKLSDAESAAKISATIDWLKDNHCSIPQVSLLDNRDERYFTPNGKLILTMSDIVIEKEIPRFLQIAVCRILTISGLKDEVISDQLPVPTDCLFIRNCKNLKSLKGCAPKLEKFSVVGCPKIHSLDGAPEECSKLFKVIECGKRFTPKEIKRACKVAPENMIY